jgi:hypothetical protein
VAKIGLMAFAAALLLTGSGYTAEKIAFRCTGTLTDAFGKSESIAETTLVIDRNAGLVSGEFGQPSITSEAPKQGYGFQLGTINENIDIEGFLHRDLANEWRGRVTTFHITRKNGVIINTEMALKWDLSCISPNPDFPVVYAPVAPPMGSTASNSCNDNGKSHGDQEPFMVLRPKPNDLGDSLVYHPPVSPWDLIEQYDKSDCTDDLTVLGKVKRHF